MARQPRPVTAASWSPVSSPTQTTRRDQWAGAAWQTEAWSLWRTLGEIHYPTTYKARAVSRLDWRVTVNGEQQDDDDTALLLDAASAPLGVEEAARLLALNLEVAGAVWWLGFEAVPADVVSRLKLPIVADVPEVQWVAVSVIDPHLSETLELAVLRLRQWTPDPADLTAADSPVRAALGPASELVSLESQSVSQSRSRITQAGILLHPAEVTFPDSDPFGDDLIETMAAAIADPLSPAAQVPITIEIPGDRVEQVKWLIPDRPYDARLGERFEATIRRIAIALDVPAEMLTGLGDVNHWGQWLLQEETYRAHVAPTATTVGGVFAWSIEQLALRATSTTVAAEVEPDAGELLSRPPQLADLSVGFQLGIVTADEWRAVASLGPLVDAEQSAPPAPPAPALELVEAPAPVAPVAAAVEGELGYALARIDAELRDGLAGALDMARITARGRIGGAIRQRLRDAGEQGPYTGTPNADLAAAVGGDWSQAWVFDIVAPALEPLGRWWERQLTDAAEVVGDLALLDVSQWGDERAASVTQVVRDATQWIVEGLASVDLDAGAQVIARRAVARAGGTAVASVGLPVAVP